MLKIILGVIVGFIVWTVLWIGTDFGLMMALPWYRQHQISMATAMAGMQPFSADTTVLAMSLVRSILVSLVSGFLAALIARERTKSGLILGILLLAVGVLVQVSAWSYMPVWYHVIFLALIVPVTMTGAKLVPLRSPAPVDEAKEEEEAS